MKVAFTTPVADLTPAQRITRTNAIVAAGILARLERGMDMKDAIDDMLGAGTYDALASDVYDILRARGV